mmetsp:Transcript_42242/g.99092  ORF Transcript_42242/g.99092 Transcript_42242/m.99092 type:complete len:235 (+) Transcript_42242:686-1390(+)
MEGKFVVPMDYWYRWAHHIGLQHISVLRGTEVYSARVTPNLTTYDLHAEARYNVYMRKPFTPLDFDGIDCDSTVTEKRVKRVTVGGKECHLPFFFAGVWFDDCTTLYGNDQWCGLKREISEGDDSHDYRGERWDYCQHVLYDPPTPVPDAVGAVAEVVKGKARDEDGAGPAKGTKNRQRAAAAMHKLRAQSDEIEGEEGEEGEEEEGKGAQKKRGGTGGVEKAKRGKTKNGDKN